MLFLLPSLLPVGCAYTLEPADGGSSLSGSRTSVESSGADCKIPPMTEYDGLPEFDLLPDPIRGKIGIRISIKAQWTCRRRS